MIAASGNVGIGNTVPGTKLDITGSFRNSLATTHTALAGSGNVFVMADNTGALYTGTASGNYLPLAGGTMTGDILMGSSGSVFGGFPGSSHASIIKNIADITAQGVLGLNSPNIFAHRPVSNVEYWNGSAWVAWATTDYQYVLDEITNNGWSVDYTHRNFRFTIALDGAWVRLNGVYVMRDWGGSDPSNTFTVEVSPDQSTWIATAVNQVSINSNIAYIPIDDTGTNQYVRLTFDTNIAVGQNYNLHHLVGLSQRGYAYANKIAVDYAGNVGIGIASPQAPLNTYKTPTAGFVEQLRIGGTDNYRSLDLGTYGAYGGYMSTYGNDLYILAGRGVATEPHAIHFYTSFNGTDGEAEKNERMTIQSSGNVGIGMSAPGDKLTVSGASGVRIQNGNYDANLVFGTTDAWKSGIRVYDNGDAEMRIWAANTLGQIVLATGYNGDESAVMPTDGVFIDQNKVGIGYVSPASATGKLLVNGNVGIGTTAPSAPLSFGSGLNNTKIALYDNGAGSTYGFGVQGGQFIFHTNISGDRYSFYDNAALSNEVLTIKGTGNVGIGLTNPAARLDVANNFSQGAGSTVAYGTKSATTVTGNGIISNYYGGYFESNLSTTALGGAPTYPANNYGVYAKTASTNFGHNNSGTTNYYGGYFEALGSADAGDSSRNYGIYANASGADYNYAAILMGGFVGIGTTNPSQALEVAGTVSATAFSGSGSGVTNVNAATLSGVPIANIVYGSNVYKTTNISNSISPQAGSGFYESPSAADGPGAGVGWTHYMITNHSSSGAPNGYQMIIAQPYWEDNLYARRVNADVKQAWRKILDSGNYSGYALPLSGGTITGSLDIRGTSNGSVVLKLGTDETINAMVNTGDQLYFNIDSNNNGGPGQAIHFGANTATYPASDLMTIYDTGAVTIQNSLLINGTSKITVSTWDPLYTIGGQRYATYGTGMIGVKEESVGLLTLDCRGNTCSKTIDFRNMPEASDLWLFAQTTDLEENFNQLSVQLTPSFLGQVWYEKDAAKLSLTVKATRIGRVPAEVSYRLTAPRFDHASWSNISSEENEGLNLDKFRAEQGR